MNRISRFLHRLRIILGYVPTSARKSSLILPPEAVPPTLLLPDEPYFRLNQFIAAGLGSPEKAILFQKIAEMCEDNQRAQNAKTFLNGHWWAYITDSDLKEMFGEHGDIIARHLMREMEYTGALIGEELEDDGPTWYRVDLNKMQALIIRWELGR